MKLKIFFYQNVYFPPDYFFIHIHATHTKVWQQIRLTYGSTINI